MRATQLLLFGAVLATLAATCAASPTAGRRDAKADLATSPMAPVGTAIALLLLSARCDL